MLTELLSIVAPIYVCAGLGFLWARSGRAYDTALVTDLITLIGAPCLVFSSLVSLAIDPGAMLEMAGATLAALVCFAAVGAVVLHFAGLPRTTYLSPIVFANAGNMGLPVALFAFGEEGLALGACFFAVNALVHFTVGQWFWSGRASFGQLARTPLAYAAVAAAAVLAFGLPVPEWIVDTTRLLGGFTIPMMQLTLGVSLGRFAAGRLPRGLALSLLRIGMGFAIGVGLAALLGLEGAARGVFIVDCAMPVAVFNYMLAEQYGRDPAEVAGLVVLSTLVSFASVPLVLAYVL